MKHTEVFIAVVYYNNRKEIKSSQTLAEMQSILEAKAIKTGNEAICHLYRSDLYGLRVPENTTLLIIADEIKVVVEFLKKNIR